jgi:hypothetical protein
LLERFEALLDGRNRSDALIEAMHLWIERHEAPADGEQQA